MKMRIRLLPAAGLAMVLAACGGGLDEGGGPGAAGAAAGKSVTVGSANFPENALLAEIYAAALKAAGLDVSTRLNIGSREALFPAMEDGEISLVPEYTGALLSYVTKGRATAKRTADQVAALTAALPSGLTVLEPSQAQDQGTVTCTRAVAERYSLTSLEDLAAVSREITMGGPPEFAEREGRGLKGLKAVYGIEFKRFRPLDVAGPLTVSALKEGKVDCADLFSTQSAIAANGFVSLTDPRGLIESEAVVPLITKAAATPQVTAALNAVSAKLSTENLKGMVKRVEVDKEDPATVAKDFLTEHGLA
jgi:osmoprotectant transport system substrate-binding protein